MASAKVRVPLFPPFFGSEPSSFRFPQKAIVFDHNSWKTSTARVSRKGPISLSLSSRQKVEERERDLPHFSFLPPPPAALFFCPRKYFGKNVASSLSHKPRDKVRRRLFFSSTAMAEERGDLREIGLGRNLSRKRTEKSC